MAVEVLAHRDLDPSRLHPAATPTRRFAETSYDLMRLGDRRRDLAPAIAAALGDVIADGGLADATLLVPSTDGHGLRAVAAQLPALAATGASVHLATAYLPLAMPGGRAGPGVDGAMRAILHHRAYGRRLFLWAETAQLARVLSAAHGAQVAWLPLPVPAWAERVPAPAGPPTFAYLGSAREEKGFARLPGIVAAIAARCGGAIRFEIQACRPASGLSPACAAALDALGTMPAVRLVPGPLDEATYAALLARADAVMLPYARSSYAVRGSGIAVEAMATGRTLLVTAGTEQAEDAPAGQRLVADTAAGWAALSAEWLADLAARRAAMAAAGAVFRRGRSAAALLDRLAARESLGPLLAVDGIGAAPMPALIHLATGG